MGKARGQEENRGRQTERDRGEADPTGEKSREGRVGGHGDARTSTGPQVGAEECHPLPLHRDWGTALQTFGGETQITTQRPSLMGIRMVVDQGPCQISLRTRSEGQAG